MNECETASLVDWWKSLTVYFRTQLLIDLSVYYTNLGGAPFQTLVCEYLLQFFSKICLLLESCNANSHELSPSIFVSHVV